MGWFCWALGPEELDALKPLAKRLPETLVPGIGCGTELGLQPLRAKEGYPGGNCFHVPTFPDDPDVEVKQASGIR